MKISKSVKTIEDAQDPIIASEQIYSEAIKYITDAIDVLVQSDDDKAKEAIANLSVVIFDLQ